MAATSHLLFKQTDESL